MLTVSSRFHSWASETRAPWCFLKPSRVSSWFCRPIASFEGRQYIGEQAEYASWNPYSLQVTKSLVFGFCCQQHRESDVGCAVSFNHWCFFYCSSLVELDASFNNLLGLPINLGYGLVNLERLTIQLNKICYLPTSICQLRSLKYFDAHFNQIHSLPSEIGRLTSLEVLILNGNFNNLTEVPESISDLCNLRELDLSDNQIRALPDRFGRLEKLSKLNLDQNPLEVPPMVVVNKGPKAVKDFMDMRWANLVAEKQKAMHEANMPQDQIGWLAWGSNMLNNMTSGVSQTISEYSGGRRETKEDPWLYQQLWVGNAWSSPEPGFPRNCLYIKYIYMSWCKCYWAALLDGINFGFYFLKLRLESSKYTFKAETS